MAEHRLFVAHLDGYLEMDVLWQNSQTTALLFHPNPVQGGTMHNKVVSTMYRYARDRGYNVVRYNSRGVGGSSGVASASRLELLDALAVVDYVNERAGQYASDFWLGGFSFGGYMACLVADNLQRRGLQVARLALIAPSLGRLRGEGLDVSDLAIDWQKAFLVYGDSDKLVSPNELSQLAIHLHLPFALFEQTGHFFHKKLVYLAQVLEYFDRVLAVD